MINLRDGQVTSCWACGRDTAVYDAALGSTRCTHCDGWPSELALHTAQRAATLFAMRARGDDPQMIEWVHRDVVRLILEVRRLDPTFTLVGFDVPFD